MLDYVRNCLSSEREKRNKKRYFIRKDQGKGDVGRPSFATRKRGRWGGGARQGFNFDKGISGGRVQSCVLRATSSFLPPICRLHRWLNKFVPFLGGMIEIKAFSLEREWQFLLLYRDKYIEAVWIFFLLRISSRLSSKD